MDACTIIAKNYVAFARVLAGSYLEQHPQSRFHVLIIDDYEDHIDPAAERFEVVSVDELGIDGFGEMAGLYDVLELSTAVKPWLMRHLLARAGDGGGVLYLDPDMRLYRPLTELFAQVRAHDVVLSPHNLEPMPRDGRRPTEQDILIAGVYNLGFLGLRAGGPAEQMLDWWSERLRRDCIVDPEHGFFVDQRWMDLTPGLTEHVHVVRDPGFNVAYWNLSERPVSHRDGAWWVKGDVPLRLFHFSGFDPRRPGVLSKHQDRIVLDDAPDLTRLCREYAAELQANGADAARGWHYTYAETPSGIALNVPLRRLYRELALEGDASSLFDTDGEQAFLEAARQPAAVGGEHGVNRYMAALYEHRRDLRDAYPDLRTAADAAGYIGWAHVYGRPEIPIHESLLPVAGPRRSPPAAGGPLGPFGVNVAGYLRSELGVGEVARQAIGALDTQGVPIIPVGVPTPHSREGHAFAHIGVPRNGFPVNLVCVNADVLPAFVAQVGPDFLADRHTIGWWWWEVSAFPERWRGSFEYVDEVWAGSAFVAEALAAVSPVPVAHVRTPVSVAPAAPAGRSALGLPEGFVYLFLFDFHSVMRRKNALGLADAFLRAFPDGSEGASLVLKSINGDQYPDALEEIERACRRHPHVHLMDRYVSAPDRTRMMQSCDAYVSLHRSEGFGMTMAEAMLLGKPVIATGYSGNRDFMTPENSFLVDYELTPVGDGAAPYPRDAMWAEPDLDHAATLMRRVFEDRDEAARRARRGHDDVASGHSPGVCGADMVRRLQAAHAATGGSAVSPRARATQDSAAQAGHLLGARSGAAGGGRLREVSRRAALRAMRPHTARQVHIDQQLAAGLHDAGLELDEVSRHRLDIESAILRELRALEGRLTRLEHSGNGIAEPRIEELARTVDELRAQLDGLSGAMGLTGASEGSIPMPARSGDQPPVYPPAPAEPWSHAYNGAHARFVASAIGDARLLPRFRDGEALPDGFGRGYDERVVEFPWVFAHPLAGRLIDAGSTLNHRHVLESVRPRVDELLIVTLAPEERSFPELDVSYLYADLRDLPLRDGAFDCALSISTFEHIGMSNERYGSAAPPAADPQPEALLAAAELRRVVRPGGTLYVTVPVGRGERFPWVRTFTLDELDELVAAFRGVSSTETLYYRHDADGWRRAARSEVSDAGYRDHFSRTDVGANGFVAAEAVACVQIETRE